MFRAVLILLLPLQVLAVVNTTTVSNAVDSANEYWQANYTYGSSGWSRGVYQTGNIHAANTFGRGEWVGYAETWGRQNNWITGGEYVASTVNGWKTGDGQACGQTYIDVARLMGGLERKITHIKGVSDTAMLSKQSSNDWYWVDSFYMAAPLYCKLGVEYSNTDYADWAYMIYNYQKTTAALYDETTGLWYRDASFVYPLATSSNGEKVFWSRGNGWMFGGLALCLSELPSGAISNEFASMMQTMASALTNCQQSAGYWLTSLADPLQYTQPESSGTSLFCFGLAWGINNGVLDSGYYDAATNAWGWLQDTALQDGLVGWVQTGANSPNNATQTNTEDFGVGAFLLAGSEVYKLLGGTVQPMRYPFRPEEGERLLINLP